MSTIQEIFYLRLNCSGCRAEGWLNGVDVSRVDPISCLLDGRPVHEYILPGKNHVALLIQPDPHPSFPMRAGEAFNAPEHIFATLHLLQGPRGALPGDPSVKVLAAIEWRPQPGTPVQPPLLIEREAELPVWLPRWTWLDATPVAASEELDRQVFGVVQLLAGAMGKGDFEPYIRAAESRFQDLAQAYGTTADEAKRRIAAQYKSVLAEVPELEIAPPVRENMALRIVAGGRVIDCYEKDFEPILRTKKIADGTTPLRYPMRLAVFGRELRIIR